MKKCLLVIVPDSLSEIVAKGEIQPRYYNPGNYFQEVHVLMTNNDRPHPSALQRAVGTAQLFLHNLPVKPRLYTRPWRWFPAYLLRRWAAPAVDLARRIKPHLIRCHGADLNAYAAMCIKRELAIPYVVSLHINPDVNPTRRLNYGRLTREQHKNNCFFDFLERECLFHSDMVMPVYQPIIPYLERMGVQRYRVCYNVVSGEDIRPKTSYDLGHPVKVLCVNRLIEEKTPENIILAVRDLREVRLTIVGDGPLRGQLERLCSESGIAHRVNFVQALPNAELCRSLPDFDIFAAHLHYWELSKGLIEALLAGLPTVVNRRDGMPVPELVGDHILTVDKSPEGYRAAFEKLISDATFREDLGKRGLDHATEHWAPEKTESAYVEIYRRFSVEAEPALDEEPASAVGGKRAWSMNAHSQLARIRDGRRLFILCGFADGETTSSMSRPLRIVRRFVNAAIKRSPLQALRNHHAAVRKLSANPRNLEYLLELVRSFDGENARTEASDVVIDTRLGSMDSVPPDKIHGRMEFASVTDWESLHQGLLQRLAQGQYDTAVLVFSDALGLGSELIESMVLAAPVKHAFVINGRKRVFSLDAQMRRTLTWHRFLARSQIGELFLASSVLVVALGCAVWDALTGTEAGASGK